MSDAQELAVHDSITIIKVKSQLQVLKLKEPGSWVECQPVYAARAGLIVLEQLLFMARSCCGGQSFAGPSNSVQLHSPQTPSLSFLFYLQMMNSKTWQAYVQAGFDSSKDENIWAWSSASPYAGQWNESSLVSLTDDFCDRHHPPKSLLTMLVSRWRYYLLFSSTPLLSFIYMMIKHFKLTTVDIATR